MNPRTFQTHIFLSFRSLGLAAWLAVIAMGAPGAERQSASYVLSDETFDSGGGEASSAAFTAQGALGQLVIGVSGTEAYAVEHGSLGESPADPPAGATFDAWRLQHFGSPDSAQGAPGFDADGDGASNLVEFAFGLHPLRGDAVPLSDNPSSRGLPAVKSVALDGKTHLQFDFIRHKSAGTYTVQVASDLRTWQNVPLNPVGPPVSLGPDYERVRFVDTAPAGEAGSSPRFLRVHVRFP